VKVKNLVRSEGPYVEHTEFNRGDSFEPIEGVHKKCVGPSVVLGPGRTIRYKHDVQVVSLGALVRCMSCLQSYVVAPDMGYVEEVDGG
jgi:hypothetical protein